MIGEIMPPEKENIHSDTLDKKQIRQILNSKNCFDREIEFQENDKLVLTFTVNSTESHSYTFIHKDGKWKNKKIKPFDSEGEELFSGKILNPFE